MTTNPFVQSNELKIIYGIAIIVSIIKLNIGIGFIVGLTASLVHQLLFARYVDKILFEEKFSVFIFTIGYIFRFMILAAAIASAFLLPDYISIYGVIFGLFVLKLWLYVKELALKKGENR
ncbi:MAG: ATP synthase subunit I [Erysipelothrix sp.]|jgi:hypothetical protein|nr:ATP synthase subunit I [Erysipelothrix sp.]